jgi:nitrogen-specific signal transduction histidine kinase
MAGEEPKPAELLIPFDRVAKFVRQFSHDVRNHLGSMDLQAAYLAELISDPEVAVELKKLRGMISTSAKALQQTTSYFWVPQLQTLTLPVEIFVEDFRQRLQRLLGADNTRLEWGVCLSAQEIALDLELLFGALAEIFRNSLFFHQGTGPIQVSVRTEGSRLEFELRERLDVVDSPPESWGMEPLLTTRLGGYGLGLFQARQIVSRHGGEVHFIHYPERAELLSRISLPMGTEAIEAAGAQDGRNISP